LSNVADGIDGEAGDAIVLEIDCLEGRRHLPMIGIRRAASPQIQLAFGLPVCDRGAFKRHCRPNCQRSRPLLRCSLGFSARVGSGLTVILFTTKVAGPLHRVISDREVHGRG
jgi:hypothetical protein